MSDATAATAAKTRTTPGQVRYQRILLKLSGEALLGNRSYGVDPAFYQRFAQALGLLHEGRSPESDLEQLLREHPNDQVIAMCLERLKAADGHPPPEMVFEFDTK